MESCEEYSNKIMNVLNDNVLRLKLLKSEFSIIKLKHDVRLPKWIRESKLKVILYSSDELSIICEKKLVPTRSNIILKREDEWRILKIDATLDFNQVGVIAKLSKYLAEAKIPIMVQSSFNTDYIMVKSRDLQKTLNILEEKGYIISLL
jgi:uncharacterized protein